MRQDGVRGLATGFQVFHLGRPHFARRMPVLSPFAKLVSREIAAKIAFKVDSRAIEFWSCLKFADRTNRLPQTRALD